MQSAVVIIIFSRPDTTARVFAAIRQARPARLFIIADAPRQNKPEEAEQCAAARAITENIDWPCEVTRDYAVANMGCRQRIFSGLSAVFQVVDRAIILEDDCLPDPTFFGFCDELLDRYADDSRVTTISGDNFANSRGGVHGPASYHFTRYTHIWGWATWARAWNGFDPKMPWWQGRRELLSMWRCFGALSPAMGWYNAARHVRKGKLSSWAIPWMLTQWKNGALAICPEQNLVTNIGFGAAATHTVGEQNRFSNIPAETMGFPLVHPDTVAPNQAAQHWTEQEVFSGKRGVTFKDVRRWILGK